MRKVKIIGCIMVLLCCFGTSLFAEAATVIYGEGYGFTLLRGNEENYYDVLYDDVVGLTLEAGDYLSTDEGTFLEVQLRSSPNVLKISENTSFQITSVSGGGGGKFTLTYGRVRAKVGKLLGSDEFNIQGPSAIAGVRGTDFGYDIIADRGIETGEIDTKAQVYCFEGKVEVAKVRQKKAEVPGAAAVDTDLTIPEEVEVVETVIVVANQMVSLPVEENGEETAAVIEEFTPREIEESINNFWKGNDFVGELISYEGPEPEPVEPEKEKAAEEPEVVEEADKPVEEAPEKIEFQLQEQERKATARKNFFAAGTVVVGVGVVTEVAGILLNFFGADWFGGDPELYSDVGTALMVAGGGVTLGGLITYLGVLVNR